jgi:hypothetical protein
MDETTRNMLGFISVPTMLGVVGLFAVCLARNKRPSIGRVFGLLGGLALFGFAVFWFASALELKCAYAFTLLRIPNAMSVNGVPVSKIIKAKDAHWFTDGYENDMLEEFEDNNLTVIRMNIGTDTTLYYFAYDNRTRVLVPMTDSTAARFPALMPPGDELVDLGKLNGKTNMTISVGAGIIKLPAKWFRASVRPEAKSGTK